MADIKIVEPSQEHYEAFVEATKQMQAYLGEENTDDAVGKRESRGFIFSEEGMSDLTAEEFVSQVVDFYGAKRLDEEQRPVSPRDPSRKIPPEYFYFIMDDDKIIGSVNARPLPRDNFDIKNGLKSYEKWGNISPDGARVTTSTILLPEHRGRGIAGEVKKQFFDKLRSEGVEEVAGTVVMDNERSNKAQKKLINNYGGKSYSVNGKNPETGDYMSFNRYIVNTDTSGNSKNLYKENNQDRLSFDEILSTITDAEMMTKYGDYGSKKQVGLDDKSLSEEEQKFNLAFWAKASVSHVGWNSFGEENNAKFKLAVEGVYNSINGDMKQKDFMKRVASETMGYVLDRHYQISTENGYFSGGGQKDNPSVGSNIAYNKNKPDSFELIGQGTDFNHKGEEYPLWQIGTMKNNGEDVLVVSIPNLGNKDGSYESWQGFIEAFDDVYLKNKEKWDKGRVVLDVRGNGGGEDKPIDHVAKRLYGNMVNTYKRCEINDSPVSNKFLHDHGAFKPANYEKDGIKAEDLGERKHFSNKNQGLFDETQTYYPFNEDKGYKGNIDILIDRQVGSSAESAYTSFYHHPNVRYVGENTAGMQQYTQGSLVMPCGYDIRIGVTKLTYWDKSGENIEVKGHQPDVKCQGKDAFAVAMSMEKDEGRVKGFRELNEPVTGEKIYADYNPKDKTDPRKAYYAKYLEPALKKLEQRNINNEKISKLKNRISNFDTKVPYKQNQALPKVDLGSLKVSSNFSYDAMAKIVVSKSKIKD